ncbi:MAG: hypothetical protein ACRBCJ_04950 [Hyphomicrobiaceae bacterium]
MKVEKLMSLSRQEFQNSMGLFLDGVPPTTDDVRVAVDGGEVSVVYTAQPGVVLGGLMALPRAVVSLTFEGVSETERDAFLRKFDIAFQRGGG